MAKTQVIILVSLLLLPLGSLFVTADFYEEAPSKRLLKKIIVVEGIVYCQSCKYLGTSSLSEADPIPLAKVSVNCTNHKNDVFYFKEFTTNEDGYFYANLEGFSIDHLLLDNPLTSCKVKLVSSSIKSCDIFTKINNGDTGASLRHEHKRLVTEHCDTVFYAAGPLSFSPNVCNADGTNY